MGPPPTARRSSRRRSRPPPPTPGHHEPRTPPAAAMTDPRRRLPAVESLLAEPGLAPLFAAHPRALVVRAVRDAVDAARAGGGAPPAAGWEAAVRDAVARLATPSLAPVINATGVVLHTNLGRAPLAPPAIPA